MNFSAFGTTFGNCVQYYIANVRNQVIDTVAVANFINSLEDSEGIFNELTISAAIMPQSACAHCGDNKLHDFKKCRAKAHISTWI